MDGSFTSLGDLGRHIAALNLSGGGARDRFDDVNHFWTFEIGERRAAMGDQFRFGRLARECYRRRHFFAVNPIRDAEAHRFADGRRLSATNTTASAPASTTRRVALYWTWPGTV